MKILVTGAAGFIGAALCERLLRRGDDVFGVDNLNDYYDVQLKRDRLARILELPGFGFAEIDVADRAALAALFRERRPARVVHLAAQAGVRWSIEHPEAYVDSNLLGFANVLEGCRRSEADHLVFASSSSVYGANARLPYSEHDHAEHPLSLYGATKKANEMMAHAYAHLYRLPVTGLRFFTVYGPWGRPDMAPMTFARRLLAGEPLELFNEGRHQRDFTYIDDAVESIVRVLDQPARPDPAWDAARPDPAASSAPYRLYNVGNQNPVALGRFIELLEGRLGRRGTKTRLPLQPGDMQATHADVAELRAATGYAPATPLEEGVRRFAEWYLDYYRARA